MASVGDTIDNAHRLYSYLRARANGDTVQPSDYWGMRRAVVDGSPFDKVPPIVQRCRTLEDFDISFGTKWLALSALREQFAVFFDYLESSARSETKGLVKPLPGMVRIFISHASRDRALAKALADLIRDALNLSASAIRCTSAEEYALDAGADTDDQLRDEIASSRIFIAILTLASLRSQYVLFELGSRWGIEALAGGDPKQHFLPLVAGALEASEIQRPLAARNARDLRSVADIHRVLANIASALDQPREDPAVYANAIEEVRTTARELPETRYKELGAGALRVLRALLDEEDGRFLNAERKNYAADVEDLLRRRLLREARDRLFLTDEGEQLARDYLQAILLRG